MTISQEKRSLRNNRAEVSRAERREWIGLGVLALACVLYAGGSTASRACAGGSAHTS